MGILSLIRSFGPGALMNYPAIRVENCDHEMANELNSGQAETVRYILMRSCEEKKGEASWDARNAKKERGRQGEDGRPRPGLTEVDISMLIAILPFHQKTPHIAIDATDS